MNIGELEHLLRRYIEDPSKQRHKDVRFFLIDNSNKNLDCSCSIGNTLKPLYNTGVDICFNCPLFINMEHTYGTHRTCVFGGFKSFETMEKTHLLPESVIACIELLGMIKTVDGASR